MKLPCCGTSFCDKCTCHQHASLLYTQPFAPTLRLPLIASCPCIGIRKVLLDERSFAVCPACQTPDMTADELIPDRKLRRQVADFNLGKYVPEKKKPVQEAKPQQMDKGGLTQTNHAGASGRNPQGAGAPNVSEAKRATDGASNNNAMDTRAGNGDYAQRNGGARNGERFANGRPEEQNAPNRQGRGPQGCAAHPSLLLCSLVWQMRSPFTRFLEGLRCTFSPCFVAHLTNALRVLRSFCSRYSIARTCFNPYCSH